MRRVRTPEEAIRDLFTAPIYVGRFEPEMLEVLVTSAPAVVRGETEFRPIPGGLTPRHDGLGGCACPWCSPDRKASTEFAWDTVAYSCVDGGAWMTHYPALHHWPMRRAAY